MSGHSPKRRSQLAWRLPLTASGAAVVAGLTALGGCSVDQSDILFVPDSEFEEEPALGGGGAPNVAAGGSGSTASRAGSNSTTGGSSGGSNSTPGGSAGSAPEMCSLERGSVDVLPIDDLEDGDSGIEEVAGRRGGWYTFNDGTDGEQVPAPMEIPVPSSPGASGSLLAMHTTGGGFMSWGAVLALNFSAIGSEATGFRNCPYDASMYEGIRISARGNVQIRVQLVTAVTQGVEFGGECTTGATCGDHYGLVLTLSPEYESFEIPFSSLKQMGWGKKNWDPTKIMSLEFRSGTNVEFDYWIDDIEFY